MVETVAAIPTERLPGQLLLQTGMWLVSIAGATGLPCFTAALRQRQAARGLCCGGLKATEVALLAPACTLLAALALRDCCTAGHVWLATFEWLCDIRLLLLLQLLGGLFELWAPLLLSECHELLTGFECGAVVLLAGIDGAADLGRHILLDLLLPLLPRLPRLHRWEAVLGLNCTRTMLCLPT